MKNRHLTTPRLLINFGQKLSEKKGDLIIGVPAKLLIPSDKESSRIVFFSVADPFHFDTAPDPYPRIQPKIEKYKLFFKAFTSDYPKNYLLLYTY